MATRSTRKSTVAPKAASHARGKPLKEVGAKDMSPEAIHERRSAAQKAAKRMVRVSTAEARAKDLKVVEAKAGQETAYDTLKKVWSAKGEIVANLGGKMVEVKKADVVRQLKSLPRDAKSPFKLTPSPTDELVHILA